ncbi:cell wall-binding repeat-containing protein [Peptacetobacter sp. AB845]|uniref:cell wall-binding repeat-containing protein n=1 Tax=Peptacetobacter sp. AB845 TaxID=3388429 RepID=UPI0039C8D003
MNKKKLSVVMAGAMLATTVAPVMAATTSEESANQLGLLIGKVRDILESKKFSDNEKRNTIDGVGNVSGQSVYYVKINGVVNNDISKATKEGGMALQEALQTALGNLAPGTTVEIWSRGFVTEGSGDNEQIFATELKTNYSKEDMADTSNLVKTIENIPTATNNKKILADSNAVTVVPNQSVTINLQEKSGVASGKIVIKPGDKVLDFTQYLNNSGNATEINSANPANPSDFHGFPKKSVNAITDYQPVADSLYETINITGTAPNTFKTSDLFNGVMLTTEGHDLLTKIEESANPTVATSKIARTEEAPVAPNKNGAKQTPEQKSGASQVTPESSEKTEKTNEKASGSQAQDPKVTTSQNQGSNVNTQNQGSSVNTGSQPQTKETTAPEAKSAPAKKGSVVFSTIGTNSVNISTLNYNLPKSSDGTYGFNIALTDANSNVTNYVVKGDKKDTTILLNWLLTQNPKVDILAGENRYETAVKVAEKYANENNPFADGKGDVVMVNGNSLVDGLSASPLAASLNAPMLLTESNRIPKATADYLKKLSGEATVGDLSGIKIHLVGGTAVISKELERELKSYGFTVDRFNGKNREDTSMKVAKKVIEEKGNTTSAFVVGAEGEADAMSIASVASSSKISASGNKITPIIVSNKNGLSDDALSSFNNKAITIVGGEAVVSKSEYNNIKEAVGTNGSVSRVAGENRQETNAKVINIYYKGAFGKDTDVLVAKDGQRNKMELVDALTVSNLAALNNSPIVLATNKLAKSQINALELNAKQANALYQVGHGVSLNVVKTIANNLGLN